MEVMALDENLGLIGYLPYINLQWKRRYYEPGEFTAQIRKSDYLPGAAYLYSLDRPEVGVLQKVQTYTNVKGDFLLISGHFAEKIPDRNMFHPKLAMTGTPSAIAAKAISAYAPDGFSFAVDSTSLGTSTSVEWLGQEVSAALFEMLKTQELSQRIYFDYATNSLRYKLWQGVDRTQSQSLNPWALFTDESAHMTEFGITEDDSSYKNYAVVLWGDSENHSEMTVDMRQSSSELKRRMLIENYGTDQVEDEVRQEALERLQDYAKIVSVEIKTAQEGLVYLKDYDLGDKCDLISYDLQKSYESRLIGVNEVFKQGRHIVTLEFGEKIPTQYNKLNRLVRSMRR